MAAIATGRWTWVRAGLLVAGLAAVLGTAYASAAVFLPPWVEGEIARALGQRVTLGDLSWQGRHLLARDVVVYGRAPFEREALARIARARVRLGGAGGAWYSPSAVELDGADILVLATRGADNVRGSAGVSRSSESGAVTASVAHGSAVRRPSVSVASGRLRIIYQAPDRSRIELRTQGFEARLEPDGRAMARAQGATIDVEDLMSLRLPGLKVSRDGDTQDRTVRAQACDVAIDVPGGGTLVNALALDGQWSADAATLTLGRAATSGGGPPRADSFHLAAKLTGEGATIELDTRALALAALRPLLIRYGFVLPGAQADARVSVSWPPDDPTGRAREGHFSLALAARDFGLHHPALDLHPWPNLTGRVHAQGRIVPAEGRLELDQVEAEALGLPVVARGWLEVAPLGKGATRGRLALTTPRGRNPSCAGLLAALPKPVRAALGGLELAGHAGLEASVAFDAAAWDTLALDVRIEPRCRVLREPDAVRALAQTASAASGRGAAAPTAKLRQLPRHLVAAFVTAEDVSFFKHRGFDLEMIRRALAHDLEVGTFAKGASTLTQQLAKNLFLGPERTLGRKLEEAILAWRLEALMPKEKILELYLNIIELGPGIRGVDQAARAYFGKPASALSPLESAHLAALTPNPIGFARRFRDGRVDEGWLHKLYDLLGMMKRSGRLSASELQAARAAKLDLRRI